MYTWQRALLVCLVFTIAMAAAPSLTPIQDRLYRADGKSFTGILTIEWRSFEAADTSNIPTNRLELRVVNGVLKTNLAPTTTATPSAQYRVTYVSDGRIQFAELWAVPPSTTPLRVRDVRIPTPVIGGSSGGTGSVTQVAISDVTGLQQELDVRPTSGLNYSPNRAVVSNGQGQLESALGSDSECVHVDGSSGPCGTTGVFGAGFQDTEVPAGTLDGVNQIFTLADSPIPASSLHLYRNGVMQRRNLDYTISGSIVTFVSNAVPQVGDILQASYRTKAAAGPSHVLCSGTGTSTTSDTATVLGSCVIPANLLHAGDRVEILIDVKHTGSTATSQHEIRWGTTTLLSRAAGTTADAMTARVSFGFTTTSGQYNTQSWGNNLTLASSVGSWVGAPENTVTIDFRGWLGSLGTDSLALVAYTVLRYPAP